MSKTFNSSFNKQSAAPLFGPNYPKLSPEELAKFMQEHGDGPETTDDNPFWYMSYEKGSMPKMDDAHKTYRSPTPGYTYHKFNGVDDRSPAYFNQEKGWVCSKCDKYIPDNRLTNGRIDPEGNAYPGHMYCQGKFDHARCPDDSECRNYDENVLANPKNIDSPRINRAMETCVGGLRGFGNHGGACRYCKKIDCKGDNNIGFGIHLIKDPEKIDVSDPNALISSNPRELPLPSQKLQSMINENVSDPQLREDMYTALSNTNEGLSFHDHFRNILDNWKSNKKLYPVSVEEPGKTASFRRTADSIIPGYFNEGRLVETPASDDYDSDDNFRHLDELEMPEAHFLLEQGGESSTADTQGTVEDYSKKSDADYRICPECEGKSQYNRPDNPYWVEPHCKNCMKEKNGNCGSDKYDKDQHCFGHDPRNQNCEGKLRGYWGSPDTVCNLCKNFGEIEDRPDHCVTCKGIYKTTYNNGETKEHECEPYDESGAKLELKGHPGHCRGCEVPSNGNANYHKAHAYVPQEGSEACKICGTSGAENAWYHKASETNFSGFAKKVKVDPDEANRNVEDDDEDFSDINGGSKPTVTAREPNPDEFDTYTPESNVPELVDTEEPDTDYEEKEKSPMPDHDYKDQTPTYTVQGHGKWCSICKGTGLIDKDEYPEKIAAINDSKEFKEGTKKINQIKDPDEHADALNKFLLEQYKCREGE